MHIGAGFWIWALIWRNHVARIDNHLVGVDSQEEQVGRLAVAIAARRIRIDQDCRIVGAPFKGREVNNGSSSHLLLGERVADEHVIVVVVVDGSRMLRLTRKRIGNQTELDKVIQIVPAVLIGAPVWVSLTVDHGD